MVVVGEASVDEIVKRVKANAVGSITVVRACDQESRHNTTKVKRAAIPHS